MASTTEPSRSRELPISLAGSSESSRSRRLPLNLSRHPAWPVTALLIGYPLWWALGLADFMWIILAIPMAIRMIGWRVHNSRSLRMPPGFGIWLSFLIVAFAGIAVLGLTAPGTTPSPVSHRVFAYAYRNATYVGITVLLLYVGNLTESELPRRRLAWMLGLVAIYTVLGGLAGMVRPQFSFNSPFGAVLPHSIRSNTYVQVVTHPGLAQVQGVQGVAGASHARPKAPFDYTNAWGASLTLLMAWLIVGWWPGGTRRRRLLVASVVIIAVVPLLYSLNRNAWAGAAIALAFLLVLLVGRRPRALVATLSSGLLVIAVIAFATPVPSLIASRLSNGGSVSLRSDLDSLAVKDGLASPVIGYGDTRKQIGSQKSISVGPNSKCAQCGQQEVGSTGQLWLLLVCNGIVGTILYVAFFAGGIWRFRRDRTPYGYAGILALVLSLLYMISYTALSAPFAFTMLAYAMLWRNDVERRRQSVPRSTGAWQPRLPERTAVVSEPIA